MPIRILPKDSNEKQRRAWNSPQNRRERQKEYMDKHGQPAPRRKRLGETDKQKTLREAIKPFGDATRRPKTGQGIRPKTGKGTQPKKVNVFSGGDEKIHKKPHATAKGSLASLKRAAKRWQEGTYKSEDYGDKSLDTQWKAEREARRGLKDGGRGKGPNFSRPTGPHMWVRGDKRKKYASGGAVMSGKKVGCQIK